MSYKNVDIDIRESFGYTWNQIQQLLAYTGRNDVEFYKFINPTDDSEPLILLKDDFGIAPLSPATFTMLMQDVFMSENATRVLLT